jgi:Predicted membrane protein
MSETPSQSEPVVPADLPVRSVGRRVRSILSYALLAGLMLVSPLFVFLPAALFQCGIRNGRKAAWFVLTAGTALAVLVASPAAHAAHASSADAQMSLAYLLALVAGVGIPALILLPMVERAESFGRILTLAIVLSIAGLALTEVVMQSAAGFSPYADQIASARETSAKFVAGYQKAGMPADAVNFLQKWMDVGMYCLPAFLLIDITVVFLFSLLMFGRLSRWRDRAPLVTPYRFRNLTLPEWLLFAFVIGGLSPLASGMPQRVGANILAVVTFLYLLQGLAIFRSFVTATGASFFGAMFAYGMLAILTLTGIAPMLLSMAGLFDSFFDFRHFKRKDHSDESHSH